MTHILRPQEVSDKLRVKNIGTFDIETFRDEKTGTANAKNFLYGVVYDGLKYFVFHDHTEMFNFMCRRKYKGWTWFAHNAEYDLNGLLENIITDSDRPPLYNKSRFIQYKKVIYQRDTGRTTKTGEKIIHKEHVVFQDSMNYFQTKLANIGEGIGLKKIDITLDEIERADHKSISYCKRDCKVLYKALGLFTDFCNGFGINPKLTIASTAMAIFQTAFLDSPVFVDQKDMYFLDSYYGGRTEVFKRRMSQGQCYDVNSLYPKSMIDGKFPDPANLRIIQGKKILLQLLDNKKYEGVADVDLKFIGFYPILPMRHKGKNYFPISDQENNISGSYNFNELRYALDNGYVLEDAREICYSVGIDSPFTEYVDEIYKQRLHYKSEGSAFQMFCKYLLNSLYGKFGERRELKEMGSIDDYQEGRLFEEIGDSGVGYWTEYDKNGEVKREITEHTIFAWCSYVTSYARIRLYEYFKLVNFDVNYCDTDSMFTATQLPESVVGDELGQMKKEYSLLSAEFIKPKHYRVHVYKDCGHFLILSQTKKLKGCRDVEDINSTEQIIKRVVKPKEALRRGLLAGQAIEFIKNISLQDDKRNWRTYDSLPLTVSQILER